MLKSFRNFTKSRVGLVVVFFVLAVIALAFAAGDITGISGNSGARSATLVKVGNASITDVEVRERIDRFLSSARREGQNITMEQFIAEGGLELAVDELVNAAAMVEFANASGMQVSKRLVDGEIASNPAFLGFDGKFNQKTFEDLLAQNRFSPAAFRAGLTQDKYGSWLLNGAVLGVPSAPDGIVLPYASLLLERRTGIVGLVPTTAMDPGPKADDKQLEAFYKANSARYMVPERRVIRYAIIRPETLRAQSAATEAEIADAYAKGSERFAASEKRAVELVTALDEAVAKKIADAAKSGSLEAAARASGLEARKIAASDKATLGREASTGLADAAFAAAQGNLVGPTKVGTSWYVFRVTNVERTAARSLDQVRGELAKEVTDRKTAQTLANLRQSIEDGIGDGKTFDEGVRDAKLEAKTTGELTAQGIDPKNPTAQPDPSLAMILRTGFGFEAAGDEPQLVQLDAEGTTALVALDRIVPAAPRPLAEIRETVSGDYLIDQALKKARTTATEVVAKLEKGVPMAQALAEAGVKSGPAPKPFDFKRSELQGKENFIQMAFTMAAKKAKFVEASNRAGYYVVYLDKVEEKSAAEDTLAMSQAKGAIVPLIAPEYARQFVNAIRGQVNIKRNDAAILRLREELARSGQR